MTSSPPSRPKGRSSSAPRARTPWAAFLLGLPLAAGVLYLFLNGPLRETEAQRYVSHRVEQAEVVMFCCAVMAFVAKLWGTRAERRAWRVELLPAWDGKPVAISQTHSILAALDRLPRRIQRTFLARRVAAVLEFISSRGSSTELDDQLRNLSDTDALALESSYSLTRFITWAIPILGFLGTVLGITTAINGVTPEVLEKDLSKVTDGLALAFDATALGLGLTMITMFLSFVVERAEWGILEAVDHFADRQLAHRFERPETYTATLVADVRQHAQIVLDTVEQLVQRQAELWAKAMAEIEQRRTDIESRVEQRLTTAVEQALERTLEVHTRRLMALEKQAVDGGAGTVAKLVEQARAICDSGREQQAAMAKIVQAVASHSQTLARVQDGEKQLLRLQETLDRNLATLAGAATFEQAVHTLSAAIHLLITRSNALPLRSDESRGRPGAAA
jgi:biopolymer transport protein ExbB/TolQ